MTRTLLSAESPHSACAKSSSAPRPCRSRPGWRRTNAQEVITGTDPTNAARLFKITQLQASGNDFIVSFPTVLGKTYRMERSDTLATGSWTTVLANIAGTGSTCRSPTRTERSSPGAFTESSLHEFAELHHRTNCARR